MEIHGVASLSSLQLGNLEEGPILASVLSAQNPLTRDGLSLSVGLGVLRRRNFILDVSNGILIPYGPDRTSRAVDRPRIGIQFRAGATSLLIMHIRKGSPASRTKLKVGEHICALNGIAIATLKDDLYAINPPVGTAVRVGVCGGASVNIIAKDYLAPDNRLDRVRAREAADIPLPAGVGDVTFSYAKCFAQWNGEAAAACKTVSDSRVFEQWKDLARARRSAILLALSTENKFRPWGKRVTWWYRTGFAVSSLDEAIRFWAEALGFSFERQSEMGVVDDPSVKTAIVKAADGYVVDLAQCSKGRQDGEVPHSAGSIGAAHLALTVKDIHAAVGRIEAAGWKVKGNPLPSAGGLRKGASVVYVSGPDHITIELLQPQAR